MDSEFLHRLKLKTCLYIELSEAKLAWKVRNVLVREIASLCSLHTFYCESYVIGWVGCVGNIIFIYAEPRTLNPGTDWCGCEEFCAVWISAPLQDTSQPTFCCIIGLELYGCKSPPIMLKGVLNKVVISSVITFIVEFCSSLEICCLTKGSVVIASNCLILFSQVTVAEGERCSCNLFQGSGTAKQRSNWR